MQFFDAMKKTPGGQGYLDIFGKDLARSSMNKNNPQTDDRLIKFQMFQNNFLKVHRKFNMKFLGRTERYS